MTTSAVPNSNIAAPIIIIAGAAFAISWACPLKEDISNPIMEGAP